MAARPIPQRHWRSYGNDPLSSGAEALEEPLSREAPQPMGMSGATKMSNTTAREVRTARMIAMRTQGMTLRQIGDEFGISYQRVRQVLVRAGVKGGHSRYWTPREIVDLRNGLIAGRPPSEIGQTVGRSESAVIGKATRIRRAERNRLTGGAR